jgi:hypothetical protein
MTLALLLLFVVPLTLAIVTIVGNADRLVEWAKLASRLPPARGAPALAAGPARGGQLAGAGLGAGIRTGPARPVAQADAPMPAT